MYIAIPEGNNVIVTVKMARGLTWGKALTDI